MSEQKEEKSGRFAWASSPHLVPFGKKVQLRKWSTTPPKALRDEKNNERVLAACIEKMQGEQAKLLANDSDALLLIFQAMDAAGKDGTIKAVMSALNPTGIDVVSFKKPSDEELDHDFLWRVIRRAPERGRIGVFNRSHYEEVLVVRVHPEYLGPQRIPNRPKDAVLFDERYESIRDFEKHLARNGTRIVKFFLNVSQQQQRQRFLERIEKPESNWKFRAADIEESELWPKYREAYEEALRETSRPFAPWYAIPADDKSYMRRAVAEIVLSTMQSMKLRFPALPASETAKLQGFHKRLLARG